MNKRLFIELLHKQLNGKSTAEEDQFLEKYYALFEAEPEVLACLSEHEKNALKADMYGAILKNIEPAAAKGRQVRMKPGLLKFAAAAVFILVVAVAAAVYLTRTTNSHPDVTSIGAPQKKENHLVLLPDGSTVIVSWGSKLSPATDFGLQSREVYLEGQAYFDIRHNAARPFIVHTGKLVTTVLGTAFNVKALAGEENITVTVTRGKVKISALNNVLGILKKGQQITYNKKKDSTVHESVDIESRLGWKDEDLSVDNVTVGEAAILLGERYNVQISVRDSLLANSRFTTVFTRNESLDEILKSICAFNGADYLFDTTGTQVVISKTREN